MASQVGEELSPVRSSHQGAAPKIRFIVTGFGPFQGVPANPTSQIVQQLKSHLQATSGNSTTTKSSATSSSSTCCFEISANDVETRLLEVSACAVRQFLDALEDELAYPQQRQQQHQQYQHVVLLHLGVNYKGKGFQLESCAYNDATFRIPDEQGYQPKKECIVSSKFLKWNAPCRTNLNVQDICNRLQSKYEQIVPCRNGATIVRETGDEDEEKESASKQSITSLRQHCKVFCSTDPGRFVCNYIYCYSLTKFGCSDNTDNINETHEITVETDHANQTEIGESPPILQHYGTSSTRQFKEQPKVWSLFLHVPPAKASNVSMPPTQFQQSQQLNNSIKNRSSSNDFVATEAATNLPVIIPLAIQLEFVEDLMKCVQQQILTTTITSAADADADADANKTHQ